MKLISMLVEMRCHKDSEQTYFVSMPVEEAFALIKMSAFGSLVVKMVPEYEPEEAK